MPNGQATVSPNRTVGPDEAPTRVGAMCGACGAGRYAASRQLPGRVRCVRCGNGRPAA